MRFTENPNRILSREAAVALEAMRFVKEIAGGKVTYCGAGESADWVTRHAANAGGPVAVQDGDILVEAGAAIADAANIASGANGVAVTAAAGNQINGKVVNGGSAAASGEKIPVHFYPRGQSTSA